MKAVNELKQESALPKSFIERLDRLSARCMSSGDGPKKATRLLSLANFYGLITEHQRAGLVLEYLSREPSVGGAQISVRSPSPGGRSREGLSAWDRHQYRLSLARAETLLETDEPDLAVNELLEHGRSWELGNPEEQGEYVRVMWLALASKVWKPKVQEIVPKWDLLGGRLGKLVDELVPSQLADAWNCNIKAWYRFAMSDFAECRAMLDQLVIPELEKHASMSEHWPNLWVKSFGVLALVAAEEGNESHALAALSKVAKTANTSHDALNREFELLVRMEAMAMLSKSEEASAAESAFLELEQEADGEESPKTEKTRIYIGPKAFVRTMAAVAWSCFRHPLTETVVDLRSGATLES
jgi:hypothetical protein